MKLTRHSAILEIIQKDSVETQEELAQKLKEYDIVATQATISRDIRELGLIKVLNERGAFKYATRDSMEINLSDKYKQLFSHSVLTLAPAGGLIVIKTLSSSAGITSEAIDSFKFPEIVGSLAGDNTVFIALRDAKTAADVIKRLHTMIDFTTD